MVQPSLRTRSLLRYGIAPLAILLAGGMAWQASSAAFTAVTRNAGNSWSSGSVALTDDDLGVAAFTVTNVVPGQTGTKCLVVKSTATMVGEVRSYVSNLATNGGALADHILIKIEPGTGGSFNSCTGFVASTTDTAVPISAAAAARYDYATGGHPWTTTAAAGGETRSYRGTWTFDTTGMTQAQIDGLQGSSITADLVWEFRSN
jgi:hypothetical protein